MIFKQVRTGLVIVLRLNTISGFQYWASTRPRTQTFKSRLKNESRVGTLLCRNLLSIYSVLWIRSTGPARVPLTPVTIKKFLRVIEVGKHWSRDWFFFFFTWTMAGRCVLRALTDWKTSTTPSYCIRSSTMLKVMNTPVRPTPALIRNKIKTLLKKIDQQVRVHLSEKLDVT